MPKFLITQFSVAEVVFLKKWEKNAYYSICKRQKHGFIQEKVTPNF